MGKEQIKKRIEAILATHKDELDDLLGEKYRSDIRITLGEIDVQVTVRQTVDGRKSGIEITHDGISEYFPSKEALLFSIRKIGCQRFADNQGRAVILSRERPQNLPDNQIEMIEAEDGLWYVRTAAGIVQRVNYLNSVYDRLGLDWKAKRFDE